MGLKKGKEIGLVSYRRWRGEWLCLSDRTILGKGADEFERAKLTTIRNGHTNNLRPQSPHRKDSSRLLIQRGGGNLQRQATRPCEVAASGEHGAPPANIQDRCEIQKVFSLVVDSARKNRNR